MIPARTMRRAVAASALILAATTTTTGCATRPDLSPAQIVPGPTPTTTDVRQLHLPIEAYMVTPAQSLRYETVSVEILRDCMARYGFDYPPATNKPSDDAAAQQYAVMYRRYGVTDLGSVRLWGYHLPRQTSTSAGEPTKPGPNVQEVLQGRRRDTGTMIASYAGRPVPKDGCLGEAERLVDDGVTGTLQGPATAGSGIVATIKSESFARSMADPTVRGVFARWSTCMAEHGFQLTDPMHATDHLDSMAAAKPGPAEIAQAVADVGCKARVNLVGIWFAVESGYQRAAISAHRRELDDVARARTRLIERLAKLSRQYSG